MLMAARAGALALALLLALFAPIEQAGASHRNRLICDQKTGICLVVVADHGTPGSTAGPADEGREPTCQGPAGEVPCFDDEFGWFNQADGCYYRQADPQPPADDPVWDGHHPDGAVYLATCLGTPGTGGGFVWWPDPPPGYGGSSATPAQLANEAVRRMRLAGPVIGIVPEPGKTGLVGLPVWMWTEVTPRTWGPLSVTASVPGLSVTATATAQRITWSMGDGRTVVCEGPGTPYEDRFGGRSSPDCGHTYTRTSAREPDAAYTVTATTTWRVDWAGGGQRGELTVDRASTARLRIGELQVLVQ